MSASTASPASSPSRTIDVIVSIHENEPAIQLKFLSERLNWDNLVSFIQSSSTLEPPVILYYKLAFDAPIETLENQEHLNRLLSALDSPSSLRFYGHQEHVSSPVNVSSTAAFTRLGALVDQHKHVLKSSHRLSRWVGILASMMASSDRSFEHEFQALENLIQRKTRKFERRCGGNSDNTKEDCAKTDGVISVGEDEEFTESPKVIDLDARLNDLDISGHPGFGGYFGRGGPAFGFGGDRGRHGHPISYGFFEACHSGTKRDKPEMDKKTCQEFAQFFGGRRHHDHHHRPHPPHGGHSSDSEGEAGFGKFGGGRHHHHHGRPHLYGRPHSFGGPRSFGGPFSFDAPSDSDEDAFGPRRGKHFGCRGGRGGFGPAFGPAFGPRGGAPPAFDSDEELFGRRGFGGPGFGGPGFGGRHGFGKNGKHQHE
ncbi:hypothetical protein MAM1_0311c09531 [Mucor ambiguus]|uniref:Uncharacterized protein n=1 Tax=Mucor ambiguus TaxID=91626 RepID=A0A0C9N1V9_9FUNG|nr:hypothetical protein MAM1_0311c09531 [Mucor ambiguus]